MGFNVVDINFFIQRLQTFFFKFFCHVFYLFKVFKHIFERFLRATAVPTGTAESAY